MGMRDYAVNDYGLFMTEDMLKTVASKYFDDYEEEYREEFFDGLHDNGIVEWIADFSGEAIYIDDNGIDDYCNTDVFCGDMIYYIPIARISTLFKSAYNNIEEMVDEFKERIGEYFTEDFDYRKYIRHIVGTYYG